MAAVSPQQVASALTPPSSSHGGQNSWNFSVPTHGQPTVKFPKSQNEDGSRVNDRQVTNGTSLSHHTSRPDILQKRTDTLNSSSSSKSNQALDAAYLAPARVTALHRKDSTISDSGSAPDSLLDLYGTQSASRSALNSMDFGERKENLTDDMDATEEDPERSRWIHRDKLARIESRELQAAGIVIPRVHTSSKSSRGDRTREQHKNGLGRSEEPDQQHKREPVGPLPAQEEEDSQDMGWDLRLPEEAAEDVYRDFGGASKGASRIPLSTSSPLPVPLEFLERDTPIPRRRSNGWVGNEEAIGYPKPKDRSQVATFADERPASPTRIKRMGSDTSPTKKSATNTIRNGSGPTARSVSGSARPKTRSGTKNDSAAQRPPTRSGEMANVKSPEGDPPWLVSMFKPDPRLPPDQQLLPTVARRLQQEQWEREGKFGNVYDRDFRPLNEDDRQSQPELVTRNILDQKDDEREQWPLRGPKSPPLSTGRPSTSGGYSTMPKINGTPQSPLKSGAGTGPIVPQPLRLQVPPEDTQKKGGCGCCIVM